MPVPVVQYFPGMENMLDDNREINDAVKYFRYRARLKPEDLVFVDEVDRYKDSPKQPYAHRYRIRVVLGDKHAEWPYEHGRFLTKREVVDVLHNLHAMWRLVDERRVDRNKETGKRIAHLNHVAKISEAEVNKW